MKQKLGLTVYANDAWTVRVSRKVALSVHRRQRSKRFGYEWHNHGGIRYLSVTVGDPKVHQPWAFSATLYLP